MLESLTSLSYGFNIALQPQNLLYCFIGVTMADLGRCASGDRSHRDDRVALASHVQAQSDCRHHHAFGHLLWSYVRWLDHFHFAEYPRRGILRRHLSRWLPDGP